MSRSRQLVSEILVVRGTMNSRGRVWGVMLWTTGCGEEIVADSLTKQEAFDAVRKIKYLLVRDMGQLGKAHKTMVSTVASIWESIQKTQAQGADSQVISP